jgi:hypothetical protein
MNNLRAKIIFGKSGLPLRFEPISEDMGKLRTFVGVN